MMLPPRTSTLNHTSIELAGCPPYSPRYPGFLRFQHGTCAWIDGWSARDHLSARNESCPLWRQCCRLCHDLFLLPKPLKRNFTFSSGSTHLITLPQSCSASDVLSTSNLCSAVCALSNTWSIVNFLLFAAVTIVDSFI